MYNVLKPFLLFFIIFLLFGKKSIICADDLVFREENFLEKTAIICD